MTEPTDTVVRWRAYHLAMRDVDSHARVAVYLSFSAPLCDPRTSCKTSVNTTLIHRAPFGCVDLCPKSRPPQAWMLYERLAPGRNAELASSKGTKFLLYTETRMLGRSER